METISNKVNENQVIGRKIFQYKKSLGIPEPRPFNKRLLYL